MTIETEDALRAALHRARSWIATDPAVDDDPYSILIDVDAALSLPSSGEQIERHANAMSDALLKVRPLGGSELFVQVGDAYYADPKYCGDLIDKMRADLHEAKVREATRKSSGEQRDAVIEALQAEYDRRYKVWLGHEGHDHTLPGMLDALSFLRALKSTPAEKEKA